MYLTKLNCEATEEIIKILVQKKRTIAQAKDILNYVSRIIQQEATVQPLKLDLSGYEEPTDPY